MKTTPIFPYIIPAKEPFLESRTWSAQKTTILGIPFDKNACFRKGTRFGPDSLREFSQNLESFSPYCQRDLLDLDFCDLGNLDIEKKNVEETFHLISETIGQLLSNGHRPLIIGGDHSISMPIVQSFAQKYPDIAIIQFDAHADLREKFQGNSLSNACAMGNILKILENSQDSLFQFGTRSFDKEEYERTKELNSLFFINSEALNQLYEKIKQRPVYLTIDLDVFDPGFFPGTGTPEAGGISFNEFVELLPFLAKFNIKGVDLVELAPNLDPSGISSALAAKVAREFLLNIFE